MKSSLERVNIVRIRHKEPTPLDFFTLFHMTDNNVRDRMLKENNTVSSLYLYSNETQTTTTYLVNPKHGERPLYILEAMFQIMNEAEFDYYIIVTEAWRNKERDKKYGYGEISKLPISEKQECLSISGKSKDGKESLTILYNIIRIKPEDDSSKIIGFEKYYEGNYRIRAELAIKRKWFPSIHELLNSITTEAPDANEHEVYCCILGIKRIESGIEKAMVVIHKNPDILNNAVEPIIAEELLRFKKERNCHNVSVLETLHVSSMSAVSKNGQHLFSKVITVFVSEDYKGDFEYITCSPASPYSEVAIYAHREDDDYSAATPIKTELVKRESSPFYGVSLTPTRPSVTT